MALPDRAGNRAPREPAGTRGPQVLLCSVRGRGRASRRCTSTVPSAGVCPTPAAQDGPRAAVPPRSHKGRGSPPGGLAGAPDGSAHAVLRSSRKDSWGVPRVGQKPSSVQPTRGAQAHRGGHMPRFYGQRCELSSPTSQPPCQAFPLFPPADARRPVSLSFSPQGMRLTERRKAHGTLPPAPGRQQNRAPCWVMSPNRESAAEGGMANRTRV